MEFLEENLLCLEDLPTLKKSLKTWIETAQTMRQITVISIGSIDCYQGIARNKK